MGKSDSLLVSISVGVVMVYGFVGIYIIKQVKLVLEIISKMLGRSFCSPDILAFLNI